jgi:hypothetical protein
VSTPKQVLHHHFRSYPGISEVLQTNISIFLNK